MNQILQGKPMTIFGDGRQTRAFTHVSDVAPVVAKSVNYEAAYNEVFNIGADQPWEILQLATEVANVMGVEPKIQHLETRHEVVHAFSNHDKVTEFFSDIKTTTSLTEGLEKMAEWVKKNGAKVCPPFENIEVWKNMPESWIKLVNRNI